MKSIKYSKYTGFDWDSLSLEDLLNKLSDYLLQSGFSNDRYGYPELGREHNLQDLRDAIMDALLLLQPTASAIGYEGNGDFVMDQLGRLRRRREGEIAPFLFAGLQILKPSLFTDTPEGPFSLNLLYDRALSGGRLYGLRHDGSWYHVGTPEDLQRVEAALRPGSEQVF